MKNFNSRCSTLLAFLILLVTSNNALSEIISIKAVASIEFDTGIFTSEPSKKQEIAVLEIAKMTGWNNYIATFDGAKKNAYNKLESQLTSNMDNYIISSQILDRNITNENLGKSRLTIAVKLKIDDTAVQSQLNQSLLRPTNEYLTFMFVTRYQGEVKSYKDRNTSMYKSENRQSISETSEISKSYSQASDEKINTLKVSTGGSSVKKRDQISWVKGDSNTINSEMNNTLINAGFQPVEYGDIHTEAECTTGLSVEQIEDEYVVKNKLSSSTLKGVTKTAKKCDVAFAALGTLDVMMSSIDPVTGNKSVYVVVTSKVYDTRGRFSKAIGSVGPVQYQGLGPNETVARNNALSRASRAAAETIVNQLNTNTTR